MDNLLEDNSIISTDISENPYDIDVEYENTFENTYNTLSENNGGISTYSTLNWSVKAAGTTRSTSEWTLKVGDFIDFDLTFPPH